MTPFDLHELKKEVLITSYEGGSDCKKNIIDFGEIRLIVLLIEMIKSDRPVCTKSIKERAFKYAKIAVN